MLLFSLSVIGITGDILFQIAHLDYLNEIVYLNIY